MLQRIQRTSVGFGNGSRLEDTTYTQNTMPDCGDSQNSPVVGKIDDNKRRSDQVCVQVAKHALTLSVRDTKAAERYVLK